MKLYFANMFGEKGLEEYLDGKIDILVSFPSFNGKHIQKPEFCRDLFLDSGAFGKHAKDINLIDYIGFIHRNQSEIEVYANLDVIGDAGASYQNQKAMEGDGLDPLPVYHWGSDEDWLHKLIDEYDHIALGGLVPTAGDFKTIKNHVDYVWGIIYKQKPQLKVHGFGINNLKLMEYPWHSVDSSSVHVMARYGGLYTPFGTFKINPNVKADEVAYQWRTPKKLERIKDFVDEYADPFTFEDCQQQSTEGTLLRCMVSIRYMKDFVSRLSQKSKPNVRLF